MKIKYCGTRPSLSTCCSGRTNYYFGLENNYTLEITNPQHVNELLKSQHHRFEVVMGVLKEPDKAIEKPVEIPKEKPKEEIKKRGRKKKNA